MTTDIVRVSCATENCGTFPMDEALNQRLRRSGDTFTCPAGHSNHYTGENTERNLKERIGELEREVAQYKKRADDRSETARHWYGEWRDEKARLEYVEKLLLDGENGVVQVGEERFKWACECGGTGRAAFESDRDAWDAYDAHRARDACEASTAVVA